VCRVSGKHNGVATNEKPCGVEGKKSESEKAGERARENICVGSSCGRERRGSGRGCRRRKQKLGGKTKETNGNSVRHGPCKGLHARQTKRQRSLQLWMRRRRKTLGTSHWFRALGWISCHQTFLDWPDPVLRERAHRAEQAMPRYG